MSAHTAGPWGVDPWVAQVNPQDSEVICKLRWPTTARDEEETMANARLIAASPCLLKMLQRVAQFGNDLTTADLAEIDATIARATGKESA